jgi:hypothetical protein
MNRWAGPCSLLLDFGLGGWLLGHFSHVWSTVDHQCCWALGLWWTTRVLDFVRGGLKKWASTQLNLMCNVLVVIL